MLDKGTTWKLNEARIMDLELQSDPISEIVVGTFLPNRSCGCMQIDFSFIQNGVRVGTPLTNEIDAPYGEPTVFSTHARGLPDGPVSLRLDCFLYQ